MRSFNESHLPVLARGLGGFFWSVCYECTVKDTAFSELSSCYQFQTSDFLMSLWKP